ncbi:MAG: bacillithiol biosynthesis cysteine-adding enzyme BshC [Ignavibacteriales bacterium]|nr:bacillithiol biosynthesis cysteine-adding enzyme BshC [Ignavibacteriales bacterium]
METSAFINTSELPRSESGLTRLYQDYINDFDKLKSFYQFDYRNIKCDESFTTHLNQRCKHRQLLVDVLLEQNLSAGAGQFTVDNIKLLGDDNTFSIVTGQQVGLLTGPVYTIYKTITAIKLARELSIQNPQFKFVPVFWLEGEDHDFDEVNKIGIINHEQVLQIVAYLSSIKGTGKNYGPVGEITFDQNIDQFFEAIKNNIGNSEFKTALLELIQRCYKPGSSFNQAFIALMHYFFQDDGLIFISSYNKQFKQLLSPVFQKEITEFPKVSQLIIQQSAELEEQYHAQIKTKALNLFYFFKNGRYFIEPRETDFSLKGTRHFISKDDMLKIATDYPELLSPNVALRPICQDLLLPTFAYVAGPSEVAYFAQLKKVYQYFGLTMPVIYPRASVTIIEDKFERVMDKYQLDLIEFFGNPDKINSKVIDIVSEVNIDEMFQEADKKINDLTNEMKFGLNYIDPTLLGTLQNTKDKIEQQLIVLKGKVSEAHNRKHDTALKQISKITNSIFPNRNFQERELNIIHFMNKHGLDFVKSLKSEVVIDQFKHQIIKV